MRTRIEITHTYKIVCVDSNSCFEAITSLLFEQENAGYYRLHWQDLLLCRFKSSEGHKELLSVNICAEICMVEIHFSSKIVYLEIFYIIVRLFQWHLHIPEE